MDGNTQPNNEKNAGKPALERRETVQLTQEEVRKHDSTPTATMERRPRTMSQTSIRSVQDLSSSSLSNVSVTETGSQERPPTAQRKRSRTGEAGNFVGECQTMGVDELLLQIQTIIEQIVKKGDKGKNILDKINLGELMRELSMKYVGCLTYSNHMAAKVISEHDEKAILIQKLQNTMDENSALKQQIISLQQQVSKQGMVEETTPTTYLQMASKGIMRGQQLPIPTVPESVRMFPSEKILIFKAGEKGTLPTKEQSETFRAEVKKALGEELIKDIVVIRPTRYGGHTIIFQSEGSRNKAHLVLRENEEKKGIEGKNSSLTAPKKKLAKVVCRQPPEDFSQQQFLLDMYGSNNMFLHQIPQSKRGVRIIESSTLGWIFELTSEEAAACYAQGGKIMFGYGKEIRVEEFIALQQCYRCCMFGHNAADCTSEMEYCRLCGAIGHSGKDCPMKNDKEKWSCINCKITNDSKGYNLPTDHAAAQLHKCPCAQNQKMIKKEQLTAAGIFTTPVHSELIYRKQERQINMNRGPTNSGAQIQQFEQSRSNRRKSRSKSLKKPTGKTGKTMANASSSSSTVNMRDFNVSTSSSSAPSTVDIRNINFSSVQHINKTGASMTTGAAPRMHRIQRPQSTDGWKFVGQTRESEGVESRGRRSDDKMGGTNSTSSLARLPQQTIDAQMQQ